MFRNFRASRRRQLERGAPSNELRAAGDDDGLCALPQEIHRQIFSLLPTADAAKAGFCCTMLRSTWYSVPKLIFDYNLFPGREGKLGTFVRFIDQTLAHHDESDVEEFEIWLWPVIDCDFPIKPEWITFAIHHNVQKLVLYGKVDAGQRILKSVFSCQSLVKLELAVENLYLTWSGTPSLPNLRKLKLKYLVLSDLVLGQDLFTYFPALEKLSILLCDVIHLKSLSVNASKLKEFIMCSCPGMEFCRVRYQTPPLSKFIYISEEATVFQLEIPEHLFGLVINEEHAYAKSKSTHDLNRCVIKVTRELLKANKLLINERLIEYLSMVHDLPRQLAGNVFNNLMYLDINLWPIVEHFRTVLVLLSRCPYLAELYLTIMDSDRESHFLPDLDDLIEFEIEGTFRSLYSITIDNFGGVENEMFLVQLLLACARELDIMTIVMNDFMVHNDMEEKKLKILEYEKASAFSNIVFD